MYVINPYTNRQILVGGKTHQAIFEKHNMQGGTKDPSAVFLGGESTDIKSRDLFKDYNVVIADNHGGGKKKFDWRRNEIKNPDLNRRFAQLKSDRDWKTIINKAQNTQQQKSILENLKEGIMQSHMMGKSQQRFLNNFRLSPRYFKTTNVITLLFMLALLSSVSSVAAGDSNVGQILRIPRDMLDEDMAPHYREYPEDVMVLGETETNFRVMYQMCHEPHEHENRDGSHIHCFPAVQTIGKNQIDQSNFDIAEGDKQTYRNLIFNQATIRFPDKRFNDYGSIVKDGTKQQPGKP